MLKATSLGKLVRLSVFGICLAAIPLHVACAGIIRKAEDGVLVDALATFGERAALRARAHHLQVSAAERAASQAARARGAAQRSVSASDARNTLQPADVLSNGRPYSPRAMLDALEEKFGASRVSSRTVPAAGEKNVKLSAKRHPDSGVTFDQRGFPVFDDHAKFDTRLDHYVPSASREEHMRAATTKLRDAIRNGQVSKVGFTQRALKQIEDLEARVENWTWHHHQDCGRMQLVDAGLHAVTGHVGGYKACK